MATLQHRHRRDMGSLESIYEATAGLETATSGLLTLPDRMQRVQTRIRRVAPPTAARTLCRLGFQRRFVILWAWLTLFPKRGPLPHT